MTRNDTLFMKAFSRELLLYSGQFALFYILMQFVIEGIGFIHNSNHVILLACLLGQTVILALYGHKFFFRLVFSFFVPIVYSLLEMAEGAPDLLNAAHMGFWIYAFLSAFLMLVRIMRRRTLFSEISLIVINILIFIFLYFYFDTLKEVENKDFLVITKIFDYLPVFLADKTHWFIIIGGSFLALTIALSRSEIERLQSRIFKLFGQYVDTGIRDLIIEKGEIKAEKKNLCVVFSDIKNFTRLCEENSPERITDMLNAFFDEWNSLVVKHNGTVDKYIGDAIMMIFGLQDAAGACDCAVECAIEMDARWKSIKDSLLARSLPVPENFGIGSHYGEVIVGDIGSSDRKNFTVIGDTVNVASRLESETRKTGSRILISSSVLGNLNEANKARFNKIGSIELKGKETKVITYAYRPAEPNG